MKKWYRVFFKGYFETAANKSSGTVEFQAKNVTVGLAHAVKMGKKKDKRVVMIAEIGQPSGLPDKL